MFELYHYAFIIGKHHKLLFSKENYLLQKVDFSFSFFFFVLSLKWHPSGLERILPWVQKCRGGNRDVQEIAKIAIL